MPEDLQQASLQVLPKGLLGFLELKNGGKFPQRLGSEALLPVIQLLDWYAQTNSEVLITAPSAAALGVVSFGELVVPPLECWYVSDFVCDTDVLGAGDTIDMRLGYVQANSGLGFRVSQSTGTESAGAQATTNPLNRPFFVLPADGLIVHNRVFTGAITITARARITRLPV